MDLHSYFILKDHLETVIGLTPLSPEGVGTTNGSVAWAGDYLGLPAMVILPLNASEDLTVRMAVRGEGYEVESVFHKNPTAVDKALDELYRLIHSS